MQPMHFKEPSSMYEPLVAAANKASALMEAPSTALYTGAIFPTRAAAQTQKSHHGKVPLERAGR